MSQSSRPADSPDDVERFVNLLNQHQTRLANYIEAMVADYQAAQDLLQETSLVLWRKREQYKEESSFWAWACQVAYYEVQHYRRSAARSKLIFGGELVEQIADVAQQRYESHDERAIAVRGCLEKLPPKRREIVRQRYSGNTSVEQIARQEKTTANAVSKLLQRARQDLLQCVEQTLAQEDQP